MLALPQRAGRRPRTTDTIPHRQLDQQPGDGAHLDALLTEAATWPGVESRESAVSVAGARALVLEPGHARGPSPAFLVEREFAHGHAQGDHSLHVTLPVELASAAEAAGWAEPHFLVRSGELEPTVVMLYAPRDAAEQAVVLELVRASYSFATGRPADSSLSPTPHRPTLEPST